MTNDSSTGGYLVDQANPLATDDDALTDFLQSIVVGVSGLSGTLVRPKWQQEPPTLPPVGTTWAAVGIAARRPEFSGWVKHVSTGNGTDQLVRHEALDLECSFYGPGASSAASFTRDGLLIAQNREALLAANFGFVGCDGPRQVPVLVKEQWLYRVDLTLTFNRQVTRVFPVLNLVSFAGTITADRPTPIVDHPHVP